MEEIKDPVQEFIERVHNSGQGGAKKNWFAGEGPGKGDKVRLKAAVKQSGWAHERQKGDTGTVVSVDAHSGPWGRFVDYDIKWDSDGKTEYVGNGHIILTQI
jgi:hypothetical protein